MANEKMEPLDYLRALAEDRVAALVAQQARQAPKLVRHRTSPEDRGVAPSVSSAWRTFEERRASPLPAAKSRFL